MSKKEYDFTTGFSHTIAYMLQRLDHIRTDEKYFRHDMRVNDYRRIIGILEEKIQKLEEQEELIEHECAVTGEEYK
jgi:hypothetical protein